MSLADGRDFLVDKRDLKRARFTVATPDAPAAGQVLLAIDAFALTAHCTTRAAFGDSKSYWNFFPATDPAWGFILSLNP